MMRKRNSYPILATDSTIEKRERKSPQVGELSIGSELIMDTRTGNGRSGDEDEMINVVDVSDSEERMDTSDAVPAKEEIHDTPGPSIVVDPCASMSALSTASSLPLDLSKKKRRLTASTSLTEDDTKDDDGHYSDSDQRQRKGIAGFSGNRGGSFGAGTSSSFSSTSTIKWRPRPLECEIPSRGQSPSVIVGVPADVNVAPISHPVVNLTATDSWKAQQQQQRPSVIRSADFTFEPPESTDVDEHFRKSLGGEQPTAEAAVDDHFARALGDVWWALKNRMHLTSTGEEGSGSRSSPSPASLSSVNTASTCVVVSSSNSTASSGSQSVASSQTSTNETVTKIGASTTTFPSSTPLKKRILSKAAVEAAQQLEMNNAGNAIIGNNNGDCGRNAHCDRVNNNINSNSTNTDEDSRKSLSAPSTPPPTPL